MEFPHSVLSMIKYQFENAKNICMLDKLVIFSWFFFQDDSNWADWGNDTPASNFDLDADEKKRQREEKRLQRQKEIEAKRAAKKGPMKLGAKKSSNDMWSDF